MYHVSAQGVDERIVNVHIIIWAREVPYCLVQSTRLLRSHTLSPVVCQSCLSPLMSPFPCVLLKTKYRKKEEEKSNAFGTSTLAPVHFRLPPCPPPTPTPRPCTHALLCTPENGSSCAYITLPLLLQESCISAN